MKTKLMQIAVMGAGAVGGYFGAKLAAASHEVIFIARGDHLKAMRRGGLRVNSPAGDLLIQDAVFTDEPTAPRGPADLILFCVKSYDTERCAKNIAPLVGDNTLILSLQNGVDNADRIAQCWHESRTLAGVVYLGAQVSAPGVIRHSSGGRIVFGPLSASLTPSMQAAEQVFRSAGIPCEATAEIRRAQWKKLLWNAPFCAIACLTRTTVKEIVESESLRKVAVDCMAEVREAASRRGVVLEPELIEETLAFSRTLGDFKPSMLQDLEAQKPLEYEAFNGILVEMLEAAGQDAPINRVFSGMLKHLDNKVRQDPSRQKFL
ncbi:MAG TPA: 2-dehydropantoate 2-reductase [Candidatus Binatia bacterium]|nr:2-dehydropantoate 2-reductase [Candidatus Binatia bacterium]